MLRLPPTIPLACALQAQDAVQVLRTPFVRQEHCKEQVWHKGNAVCTILDLVPAPDNVCVRRPQYAQPPQGVNHGGFVSTRHDCAVSTLATLARRRNGGAETQDTANGYDEEKMTML